MLTSFFPAELVTSDPLGYRSTITEGFCFFCQGAQQLGIVEDCTFSSVAEAPSSDQPPTKADSEAALRKYQLEGVAWLSANAANGLGWAPEGLRVEGFGLAAMWLFL